MGDENQMPEKRKSRWIVRLILMIALLWAVPGWGATYVDPSSGNDGNTGTLALPYKSLEYAVENGGDAQIYLLSGTYGGAELGASTNIWKAGTDNIITTPIGYTIEVYTGQTVTINQPSDTSGNLFRLLGALIIKGESGLNKLSVTNTSADATFFCNIQSAVATLTLQDVDIDWNNAAYWFLNVSQLLNASNTINLIRCRATDTAVTHAFIRQNTPTPQSTTILMESCIFTGMGYVWNDGGTGSTRWTLKNCDFDLLKVAYPFFMATDTASYGSTKNCIFNLDTTFLYAYNVDATVAWGGWANWTIQYNGIYKPHSDASGTDLNYLCTAVTQIFPLDETNFYLDPEFVNAPTDYTLGATSYLNGRGVAAALPTGGDYFGNPWNCTTGADMGAIANPILAPLWPTISSGIMMIGDSIAKGTADRLVSNWTDITVLGNPVAGNDYTGSALPGSHLFACKWLVDRAAVNWGASKAVFLSGHNTFSGVATTPTNLTASQAADDLLVAMKKAAYWGITPINIGEGGVPTGLDDNTTRPLAFNAAINAALTSGSLDYASESWLDRMRFNASWTLAVAANGYYQAGGLDGNVHPAAEGYELISSLVSDLVNERSDTYYVTQAGTPIVGAQYGPGTYAYPLSIAGLNAQASGGGQVDLPYGRVGKTIWALGTITTALNTPVASASEKVFTIHGGYWTGGWVADEDYWAGESAIINGTAGNAIANNGAHNAFTNLTIYGAGVNGFELTADAVITSCVVYGSSGSDVNENGGTATQSHNFLTADGDPLFVGASVGNFYPLAGSPLIGAGTTGATTGYDGRALSNQIGALQFAGHGANGPGQGGTGLMIKNIDPLELLKLRYASSPLGAYGYLGH